MQIGFGQIAVCRQNRDQPDRQIDEEDKPPAGYGKVTTGKIAAQYLANNGSQAQRNAKPADSFGAFFRIGKQHLDKRDGLRYHKCRAYSLQKTHCIQLRRRLRYAAQAGKQGKAQHTPDKGALAAKVVAGTAAGNEERGIAQQVTGDDQLYLRIVGMQPRADRRYGYVDDKYIDNRKKRRG